MNRMVTRGMGASSAGAGRAGLVTSGMGGIFAAIVAGAKRLVKAGQSGTKRALQELEDVIVWAKMIRVNDDPPPMKIQGFVKVKLNSAMNVAVHLTENVKTRVRAAWEDIKITVKRVK